MHPSKVAITKSLTVEKARKWEKAEFTIEVSLAKNDDPEFAKNWAETLIDSWVQKFEKS
jgi:hypothetical protein